MNILKNENLRTIFVEAQNYGQLSVKAFYCAHNRWTFCECTGPWRGRYSNYIFFSTP